MEGRSSNLSSSLTTVLSASERLVRGNEILRNSAVFEDKFKKMTPA
jgi:hypothetical protein